MKEKLLVIVCSIIVVITIIIVMVLANRQSENSTESASGDSLSYDYSEGNNENDYTDYYEEETTQAIKLSDSCDKIFATGTDENGNFYELVANQEETYDNVKIEIGVIKNNKWLLEPTSDIPFIDEETGLIKAGNSTFGIDDVLINDYEFDNVYGTFKYVADGCFCICKGIQKNRSATGASQCTIIYNAENKKAYYNNGEPYLRYDEESNFVLVDLDKEAKHGNHLLIQHRYSIGGLPFEEFRSDFYVLDTNTMKTKMIVEGTEYNIVAPIGDGLFAVGDSLYSDTAGNAIMYFYDLEGNEVIDLTSYNDGEVYSAGESYFVDEKFTFLAENDAGTEFQVTIDTKGNVISSVENSKQN